MLASALPATSQPRLQVDELPPSEPLDIIAVIRPERHVPRAATEPVTGVARDSRHRLVLVEGGPSAIHKIGPRTTIAEARDLALKVLDGNAKAIADPATLFKVALAFVAAGVAAARAPEARR